MFAYLCSVSSTEHFINDKLVPISSQFGVIKDLNFR